MQLVSGWYERAEAALDLNRYDLALRLVIDGLAVTPDSARLLSLASRIQYYRKAFRESYEFGQQAIGKDPDYSDGYYWMAHAMLRLPAAERNRSELKQAVRRVLEISPLHHSSHQLAGRVAWDEFDDRAEADRCYRRALELEPTNDLTLYSLGRLARQLGRLDESLDFLQKLREFHPDYGYGICELTWLYLALKKPREALQHALAARELMLNDCEAFNVLAEAAIEVKDYDLALQSVRDSLAIEPKSAYVLTLGACIQTRCQKYAEACEFARQAIAQNATYWDAHYWLANALIQVRDGTRDVRELRRAVDKTLELGPDKHASHQVAGQMYWELDEREIADRYLLRALEMKPDDEWTLSQLGRKAYQEGRYFESRRYLDRALQINAAAPETNLEMAQLNYLESREAEAVPYALAARQQLPHDAEAAELFVKLLPFLHPLTSQLHIVARKSKNLFPMLLGLLLIIYGQYAEVSFGAFAWTWFIGSVTFCCTCYALLQALQTNLPELQRYQSVSRRQRITSLLLPLLPLALLVSAVWSAWTESGHLIPLVFLFACLGVFRNFIREN